MTVKTMTLWGAYRKLEALAVAAERLALPGRVEIREQVESLLCRSDLGKDVMHEEVFAWRTRVGTLAPRTARWMDEALLQLLEYLERHEVHLSGAELLDQLLEEPKAEDADVARLVHTHDLVSVR